MQNYQRRILGILTLGGSATGFVLSFEQLTSSSGIALMLIYTSFMLLYGWGVWLGLKVLEKQTNYERQLVKYWCIQVPVFWSPWIGYFFASGFHATAFFNFSTLSLTGNVQLGSVYKISLLQEGQPWQLGINVFAVGVVWFLTAHLKGKAQDLDSNSVG